MRNKNDNCLYIMQNHFVCLIIGCLDCSSTVWPTVLLQTIIKKYLVKPRSKDIQNVDFIH